MIRQRLWLAVLAFLVAAPAAKVEAQVAFGPQVVLYDFEDFGLGGRVDFGLGEVIGMQEGLLRGLFGTFNANYVFNDSDVTQLVFNANVGVPFAVAGSIQPYAGAGLNHNRVSIEGFSASSSGLNLLGGIFLGLGTLPAFAELQYSTTGTGYLSLSVGLLFGR
jgi:opacity protein-like surface antigen